MTVESPIGTDTAKIKGMVLLSLKIFINERFGADGWERFLAAMPKEDHQHLTLPSSLHWYEMDLIYRVLETLDTLFGRGDGALVEEFGEFDAEQDLTKFQRVFLRLANPSYVLEKSSQYWSRFFSWGVMKTERLAKNKAKAVLIGNPSPNALHCRELTGYFKRMFELVGARGCLCQHTSCRAKGDDECVWIGSWT